MAMPKYLECNLCGNQQPYEPFVPAVCKTCESQWLEARYDYEALDYLVRDLHRWDACWEDWFHATGREPIRVIYEEFVDARAATVGRVLDALGIDPPEPDAHRRPMKRQADDLSAGWVARFREDADRVRYG